MVFRVYLHAFDFLGECKIYSLYFVYSVETENTGPGTARNLYSVPAMYSHVFEFFLKYNAFIRVFGRIHICIRTYSYLYSDVFACI